MERVRRRRDLKVPSNRHEAGGLSPASRLRIAADVHRHSTSDDDSGCVLEEYAWVPSGIKPDMVHLYFACLPEDKVPYVGSPGEKWRIRQLKYQLPPQDSDSRYCQDLSPEEHNELRMLEKGRKRECLGRGLIQATPYDGRVRKCQRCMDQLEEGSMCVFAARTDSYFHPACFSCTECQSLLVDLIYFAKDQEIFCGRHHAEQIKPRCHRCDELIFGDECTEAEGRTWHLHHFQCSHCDTVLGGKKYMQRKNKPVCLPCYHSANPSLSCTACLSSIPEKESYITQGDLHWHSTERCFSCCVCNVNLLGRKYSLVGTSLYCGFNTCGGEDELYDDDRLLPRNASRTSQLSRDADRFQQRDHHRDRRIQHARTLNSPRVAPRPPQRAPPPPPTQENIYETVMPCTSSSPEFEKKYMDDKRNTGNYYCKTPNNMRREDHCGYSTSSSDSDEDDDFYINNLMTAASIGRKPPPPPQPQQAGGVRTARKTKSSRCIVS